MYSCLLDATEAFECLHFERLFNNLFKRKMSISLIQIYTCQKSSFFEVHIFHSLLYIWWFSDLAHVLVVTWITVIHVFSQSYSQIVSTGMRSKHSALIHSSLSVNRCTMWTVNMLLYKSKLTVINKANLNVLQNSVNVQDQHLTTENC